ncbi:hypothetical protein N654_1131 [Lactiplantibacillus plantarum 4_3]|uniref:hypothetical protein n=1 Tax=Lactiplantibacillus plantarum TaxID=1590 RepID=UPI0003D3C4E4|nr:hypothetical protein [Lactiplantibacillus plantarum]ETF12403.1 hypothetical protein N654_1131 [Lactiplantibacillus plantarum 4_3]
MKKLSLILFTGLLVFGFTENALAASAKADTIKSESITFKGGRPVMRMPIEVGAGSGYYGADWQDMLK